MMGKGTTCSLWKSSMGELSEKIRNKTIIWSNVRVLNVPQKCKMLEIWYPLQQCWDGALGKLIRRALISSINSSIDAGPHWKDCRETAPTARDRATWRKQVIKDVPSKRLPIWSLALSSLRACWSHQEASSFLPPCSLLSSLPYTPQPKQWSHWTTNWLSFKLWTKINL